MTRISKHGQMNFKNLYMDISKLLPSVIKNQAARAMEANVMAKMRYTDVSHLENEKQWLMQLMCEGKLIFLLIPSRDIIGSCRG